MKEQFKKERPCPVQKIRFVDSFRLRCSKDSFRGFVLDTCFQITRFVDSFRGKKSQKGLIRFVLERFVYESRIPYFKQTDKNGQFVVKENLLEASNFI